MKHTIEMNKGWSNGLGDLLRVLGDRWAAVLAFLAMGLVAIMTLHIVIPASATPNLGLLGKKAEHLGEAHRDYNVLLIGTSMTYRGIDPVLLQEVAERQGCDVRAFNFGVSKLRLTELRHLREQVSPGMLKGYDLILMSPMASSGISPANWASGRIHHFTDWDGYKVSLIDIWNVPMTKALRKKLFESALLSGAFAHRQFGIGRLGTTLRGAGQGNSDNPSGDVFDGDAIVDFSRHGYVALDDEPGEQFLRRGEKILSNPEGFDAMKAKVADVEAFRGTAAERALQRFDDAADYLADYGVPVAMLLMPMLPRRAQDMALAEEAEARGLPVLNYNRLDLHPELFDREHWFDYYHLGKSGADLLTRMIGEDICSLID